jgi:hypothetical protein
MNYDDLKPGRDLDVIVAREVMGLEVYESRNAYFKARAPHAAQYDVNIPHPAYYHAKFELALVVPDFSTNLVEAFGLVELMRKTHSFNGHNGFMLIGQEPGDDPVPDHLWYCEFSQPSWSEASGDTAPFVICLAALKAVLESR